MHPLLAMKVDQLKGVGARIAARLAGLDIHCSLDLLLHLPHRYQDKTKITPIAQAYPGQMVVLEGTLVACHQTRGRTSRLQLQLEDATGTVTLTFFKFFANQVTSWQVGQSIRCFGEVSLFGEALQLVHPEMQVLGDNPPPLAQTLTPIYPTREGLGQALWRRLLAQLLAQLAPIAEQLDVIPPDILQQFGYCNFYQACCLMHQPRPEDMQSIDGGLPRQAKHRLVFEELLAHHLCLRNEREAVMQAPAMSAHEDKIAAFCQQLPFQLTAAQLRVSADICQDLQQQTPMMRLVQGDVGCGKTLVAVLAGLRASYSGFQVALMAPTEILAEQHYRAISAWMAELKLSVGWLSGSVPARQKTATLQAMQAGELDWVVGTHAIFQTGVAFARLGLVIIDEQHRFGVKQRLALRAKGCDASQAPHQLVLTATPIPRTLAMAYFADCDISVIDELPPGRQPITTLALPIQRRDAVIARIEALCRQGQQVYWICPLVESSETLNCTAAIDAQQQLQQALPACRVGLVHGKLPVKDKEAQMQAFKAGQIDILVATTVVEVGVDVPNASLIVIENPERFGLSQLHQLRGRVGRGKLQSFCILLYQPPLSRHATARLEVMRETQDGFVIAEQDLALRGPGEFLGTAQTGDMGFKVADLAEHRDKLPEVVQAADLLLARYPSKVKPIISRWLAGKGAFSYAC